VGISHPARAMPWHMPGVRLDYCPEVYWTKLYNAD
jgi:hypothetical protein